MIDFVTIIFNDNKEILLLKLQAQTFSLVDKSIINDIYIIFNDNINYFESFKSKFLSEIINCYPNYLDKKRIKLLNIQDIGLDFNFSSWFTQQIIKIEISKYVNSKYYIVLDGKNHFKETINYDYFFNKNNKPKLNFNSNFDKMLFFYNNCLNYFNVECPEKNNINKRLKIQTTTPFIFIKDLCLELISYVEDKEKIKFYEFINKNKKYTEFFLYYAFLVYINKTDLYSYHNNKSVVTIGALDPKIYLYNSWQDKKNDLANKDIKVIALHRKCFSFLDDHYKNNLFDFYKNHYKLKNINEYMNILLFE